MWPLARGQYQASRYAGGRPMPFSRVISSASVMRLPSTSKNAQVLRSLRQDRARAAPERPRDERRPGPGAWRLQLDQRHGLHARPAAGLRRLGRASRLRGLVVQEHASLFQALGELRARACQRVSRQGRRAERRARADAVRDQRCVHRRGGERGHPAQRRHQRREARGHRLRPGEHEGRAALELGRRVSQRGREEAAEPQHRAQGRGAAHLARRKEGRRHRVPGRERKLASGQGEP